MRCAKICFHTDPQASFHITTFSLSTWNVLVDLFITVYFKCELRWKYPSVMSFYCWSSCFRVYWKGKALVENSKRNCLNFPNYMKSWKAISKNCDFNSYFLVIFEPSDRSLCEKSLEYHQVLYGSTSWMGLPWMCVLVIVGIFRGENRGMRKVIVEPGGNNQFQNWLKKDNDRN